MEKIKLVTLDGLRKFLEKVNEKVAALAPQGSGTPKITGHAIPNPYGTLYNSAHPSYPKIPVEPHTGYFEMNPTDLNAFWDGYDERFYPLLDVSFKGCTVEGTSWQNLFTRCLHLREIDLTNASFPTQKDFSLWLQSTGNNHTNVKMRGCSFPVGENFSEFFGDRYTVEDSYIRDFGYVDMTELAFLKFPSAKNVTYFLANKDNVNVSLMKGWSFPEVTNASSFFEGSRNIKIGNDYVYLTFPKARLLQSFFKYAEFERGVWSDCGLTAPLCEFWNDFLYGSNVQYAYLNGNHMEAAFTMENFFRDCDCLKSVSFCEVESVYPTFPNCAQASYFCSGCKNLTRLPEIKAECFPKLAHAERFFDQCVSLTDLTPISAWTFPEILNLDYMFCQCKGLTDLSPISSWRFAHANPLKITVISAEGMFAYCSGLTDISPIGNWSFGGDGEDVTINLKFMFSNCTSLVTADISGWELTGKLNTSAGLFASCSSLQYVKVPVVLLRDFVSGWFNGCTSLENIEWDGDGVIENKSGFDLRLGSCPLTHECARRIINVIAQPEKGTPSIIFNPLTYDALSAEDIAIATAKGWTVQSASA